MKKLLVLIITINSLSLTAQEKQNDATWEETVGFLTDHIDILNSSRTNKYRNGKTSPTEYYEYQIDGNNLIVTIRNIYGKYYSRTVVDLKHISSVSTNNWYDTYLKFIPNKTKKTGNNNWAQSDIIHINKCIFSVPDKCEVKLKEKQKDYLIRIEKAFSHLAYLANQKRKKYKF